MLTLADLVLLEIALGKQPFGAGPNVTPYCAPCKHTCGDVDGNGKVTMDDYGAAKGFLGAKSVNSCTYWSLDIDGNSQINGEDVSLIEAIVEGAVNPAKMCTP